jgi:hypothetical protein
MLQIVKDQIDVGQYFLKKLPLHETRGLQGGRYTFLLEHPCQEPHLPGLEKGFPPRKGHTASTFLVETAILQDLFEEGFHAPFFSYYLSGIVKTRINTGTAENTGIGIADIAIGMDERHRTSRTGGKTLPAVGTPVPIVHHLGLHQMRLGVLAPGASEIAALQEDYRTNPRPVLRRIAFKLKNKHSPTPCLRYSV